MQMLVDILSWGALCLGAFFFIVGAVGMVRMPDVFTRMHSASVTETLGVGLMIVGMLLQSPDLIVAAKLVFILILLWTAGPIATHALGHAALHAGEKPLLVNEEGELIATDCQEAFPQLAARLATPLRSETVETPEKTD